MKIISQLLFMSMLQITCYLNLLKAFCEGNIQDRYIGCYYGATNDRTGLQQIRLQNNTTLTIELCVGHCRLRNSTYAGLENSKACLCASNFSVMLSDTSCNSLCPGNQSEYCGGSNGQRAFYSVYAVCQIGFYGRMCGQVCHCKRQAPCNRMNGQCSNGCEGKWSGITCNDINLSEKYIGCFRDNKTRAISHEGLPFANMTVEYCSNICMFRKSSILGVQAESYCMCGEKYAKYGPLHENNCSSKCTGNRSQICGGGWATSVYSVCPAGYYGPNCHNQCNCYNNSRCVFLTGECNSTCKAGWTGKSCNVRDCRTQNGDCSRNETCVNVNLKFATIARCLCLPGLKRNASWNTCLDIDECVLKLCGTSSTTNCINTIGSYNCTCKPGFHQYNNGTCKDVDECTSKIHNCSVGSEECSNTIASFFCSCKKGFQRRNGRCEDVDECDLKIHNCSDATEVCNNTFGSFYCTCKKGFQGKNNSCKDVDECDLHNCSDATEECKNTIGSFFCNCKKGFQRENDCCEGVLLEVAVGASVGSALGSAFLVVIIVIGIFMCRQRRQQNGESKDSIESRRRARIDEILENPDSSMTYEALKRTQTQDSSIYAELTSHI